jgi:hypothetical protein
MQRPSRTPGFDPVRILGIGSPSGDDSTRWPCAKLRTRSRNGLPRTGVKEALIYSVRGELVEP